MIYKHIENDNTSKCVRARKFYENHLTHNIFAEYVRAQQSQSKYSIYVYDVKLENQAKQKPNQNGYIERYIFEVYI